MKRELKWLDFIFILLVSLFTVFLVADRFSWDTFPDSRAYASLVVWDFSVGTPFVYRILVPLLAIPLTPFMSVYNALSVVSMFGSIGLSVIMYLISRHFMDHSVIAFFVTCSAMFTRALIVFGAVPLVDSVALFLCGVVIYLTITDHDWVDILCVVLVGVMCKEVILFAALFPLLYHKKWQPAVLGSIYALVWRLALTGSFTQPLSFRFPPLNSAVWINYVLSPLMVLLITIPLIMLYRNDMERFSGAFKLFVVGIAIFLPYLFFGLYYAAFDFRFAWPLQFAFLGVSGIGTDSGITYLIWRFKNGIMV